VCQVEVVPKADGRNKPEKRPAKEPNKRKGVEQNLSKKGGGKEKGKRERGIPSSVSWVKRRVR